MQTAGPTQQHGQTTRPVAEHEVRDLQQSTVCIVGAGPAGAVLGLLLARRNIGVTLLESHQDFDREFRGDTLHPSTLEIMDELGLADQLLEKIPHSKVERFAFPANGGQIVLADLSRLKTRFPYIAMVPQPKFLEFVTAEAQRYPSFRLVMGAPVEELVEQDGLVRGVRYRARDGWHEVSALLTVGADGRFSRTRHLAGFEPIKTSQPMDVLWFRLPKSDQDPQGGAMGRIGRGRVLVLLDRADYWQVGYVIPKGSFQTLRAAGLEALQQGVAEIAPQLADRVLTLQDWQQVSLLSVESSRLERWFRPGLLLIGDAAHVMTPIGGVGINYAIQDAVVTANLLAGPLRSGRLRLRDLAAVQRRRELPIRVIQAVQALLAQQVLGRALDASQPTTTPLLFRALLRVPVLRDVPARLIGFGLWPVRVEQ